MVQLKTRDVAPVRPFLTDLSDAEIVLGKLAARLIPVIGLAGCTLPVLANASLLGGIDPQALTGVFLITIRAAIFTGNAPRPGSAP